MSDVCDLTGSELAEQLRAGDLSAAALTESSLAGSRRSTVT